MQAATENAAFDEWNSSQAEPTIWMCCSICSQPYVPHPKSKCVSVCAFFFESVCVCVRVLPVQSARCNMLTPRCFFELIKLEFACASIQNCKVKWMQQFCFVVA